MAAPQFFTPPSVKPSKTKKRFTLEQANRTLPYVSRVVSDIVKAHESATKVQTKIEALRNGKAHDNAERELVGVLDRLQNLVDELHGVGCELKDYQTGLVDFIGRHQGRDVYLCWRLGEARIAYWHELQSGFAGRQPVSILDERE
jgi:hypothetical protein